MPPDQLDRSYNNSLYPEDQEKVDKFVSTGINAVQRKPFRPLRLVLLLIVIVTVLTGHPSLKGSTRRRRMERRGDAPRTGSGRNGGSPAVDEFEERVQSREMQHLPDRPRRPQEPRAKPTLARALLQKYEHSESAGIDLDGETEVDVHVLLAIARGDFERLERETAELRTVVGSQSRRREHGLRVGVAGI